MKSQQLGRYALRRKIGIIGSGVARMTAAAAFRMRGHYVTIVEAEATPFHQSN